MIRVNKRVKKTRKTRDKLGRRDNYGLEIRWKKNFMKNFWKKIYIHDPTHQRTQTEFWRGKVPVIFVLKNI